MTLGLKKEQFKTLTANDGTTIEICAAPIGALEASKMQFQLQAMLGPLLINLMGGAKQGEKLKLDKFSIAAIVNLLQESDVHIPTLEAITAKFTMRSGYLNQGGTWRLFNKTGPDSPDELFAGQMELFWGWMRFCLEVNFKSFLSSLQSVAKEGASPASPSVAPA